MFSYVNETIQICYRFTVNDKIQFNLKAYYELNQLLNLNSLE